MGSPAPEWTSTVGPYRLVRRLGAGGMGVVYLGHHQRTGTAAAVKLIRPEHAADPASRARLRREVAAARRVPRFCTAPVLDADLDGDPPWVATEYVDGASLDTALLVQGRLTGGALEHLAVGVAIALRAIHQHHVIHRDLKPSNILLSAVGPRVIDFGIARIEDQPQVTQLTQLTQAGTVIGTPAFMAPEQLSGQPLTTAVDVFGWAGLVTYAATGQPPFGTGAPALPAILHGQPDLGDLPEPLRDLVTAAFAKDPAARPSAADLVDQLTRVAPATTSQVIAAAAASPTGPHPPATPPPVGPATPPGPDAVPPYPPDPPGRTAPPLAQASATAGRTSQRRTRLVAGSVGAALAALAAVTVTAVLLTRGGLLPGDGAAPPGGEVAFESTVTLGGLLPTQGAFAETGVGMIAAAELAVEEINAAGGVWGNDVVWILEDEGTPGNTEQAAAAGDSLIAQGVNAVIGGYGDNSSLAVLEAMHHEKIIMVSPANAGVAFTDHQFGGYYFRTAASKALLGSAVAELALGEGHATLAILAEQDSYGEELADAIEQTYQSGGGQVVYQEFYDQLQFDFADEVAGLVDADRAAFVLISTFSAETIIRDLLRAGFTTQDAQWYFVGGSLSSYGPGLEEGALAGVKGTRPIEEEPAELMARVDEFAGGVPLPFFVPETYDAVMMVALAAIAADSDDPDAIKDEMVGVTTGGTPCASFAECKQLLVEGEDIDYRGYSGVTWNEQGEPVEASIGIFQYGSNNTFEQIDVVIGRL